MPAHYAKYVVTVSDKGVRGESNRHLEPGEMPAVRRERLK